MILFSKMCIFKIDTTIKCTRNTIKSKPSQKIIKMDNFVYSQVILYQTIVRLFRNIIPNETLPNVEMFERIVQGGKSTIILLQVISMELYILITIKLCEKDVPETGARTIYIIQCKVYSTVYCSQVKDQLRSLLHSSMNFCRIIHENMLLNPKKISMCNQA